VVRERGLATWSDGEAAAVDLCPADAIPLSRRCVSRTATAVGRQLIHGGDTDREARDGPTCDLRLLPVPTLGALRPWPPSGSFSFIKNSIWSHIRRT